MFIKIGVLKNFPIFTGKHREKRDSNLCFPVNPAKLLRTAFFKEHLWRQLLKKEIYNKKKSFPKLSKKIFTEDLHGLQSLS